jgi:hypothetical protein
MRKRIFFRIVWFLLLNCVIFVLLVTMQFDRQGSFTEKIGDMIISGRYALDIDEDLQTDMQGDRQPLEGGVNVFFGGLEFNLAFSEYISIMENEVAFTQRDGTELFFACQGTELRIRAIFAEDDTAITIPFKTQRSTVLRNGTDTFSISYNGYLYQFSRSMNSFEAGQLVLLSTSPAITYRVITDKKEFNPAEYILPDVETAQAFSGEFSQWISRNFPIWAQMSLQTDEDTVIAWCGEAIWQGSYRSALSVIPASFSSSPLRTWESAVYQFDRRSGIWERAARAATADEREKLNNISRMLTENNNNIFQENHLLEYLAVRSNDRLINDLFSFVENIDVTTITLDNCPGIMECYLDTDRWRPRVVNPFEALMEQARLIIADHIGKVGDNIFIFANGLAYDDVSINVDAIADLGYNFRLGAAIIGWGEKSDNNDWAGLGRSLVFSVISQSNDNGSVPASLAIGEDGELIPSTGRISTAKLYRLWGENEYLPHATITGINDVWVWTAASSVNIVQDERQMDIVVQFPVGETHYVMLRNVRPFPQLQMHEQNWRRASDIEIYDSSGWNYFENEQTLILKIRHRVNVERIRIFSTVPRVEAPPPPPPPPPAEQNEFYYF